jgi:outer membrane protein TolC
MRPEVTNRTSVMRVLPGLLVLTLFMGRVTAQPVLTLDEAIRTALANNFDIRLAENDSASFALDNRYRNVVFLPRLNATAGTVFNRNSQRQEFNDGTAREGDVATDNINASVTLNWTLFDGLGMFATRKKAEEFAELGGITVKRQVVTTVAEVINTYYAVVRQKQMLLAIREQMRLSGTRVDLARRKLEIGVGAKPDLLQSQVDYNGQRAAELRQLTLIDQLKDRLDQLIYGPLLPPDPPDYDVVEEIPINDKLTVDEIRQDLALTNPELQLLRKNIDIAALTLDEVKSDRWPVVDFNAAYNFSRTNNNIAINPFLPVYNRNKGLNFGFSATVPILNYRSTHRAIQQAQLDLKYQQVLLDSRRSAIDLEVRNAYKEYLFQQEILALEEANILLAKENVDIIQATYRLGEATFVQLREAEKSLADAVDRLIAARYNTKLAETVLLSLKGALVY